MKTETEKSETAHTQQSDGSAIMNTKNKSFDSYLECALWASVLYENETDEGTPFEAVDAEFNEVTLISMEAEFADFLAMIEPILEKQSYEYSLNDEQIAHDFWLTRNGHGAGFWDRGLGKLGEELTIAAESFGSLDLYTGDNGEIYAKTARPCTCADLFLVREGLQCGNCLAVQTKTGWHSIKDMQKRKVES
jgi:hypothetical protein